ncbi:MAG: CoA transferase subunit A [Clostridiales bacterium]
MNKIISIKEAIKFIKSGSTVMINGFMGVKNPDNLIDEIISAKVDNLTVIANDTAVPGKGIGKLISHKRINKLYSSHIGLNQETSSQMNSGELEVELIPQGTLVERIRCAGSGIGGFLTATGIGTMVEDGKQKINIDSKDYLLELPLKADIALIKGTIVDKLGNVFYRGTAKNFSLVMAMAADIVIVEAERLVEVGELDPESIMTPSLFVDYIVVGGKENESN